MECSNLHTRAQDCPVAPPIVVGGGTDTSSSVVDASSSDGHRRFIDGLQGDGLWQAGGEERDGSEARWNISNAFDLSSGHLDWSGRGAEWTEGTDPLFPSGSSPLFWDATSPSSTSWDWDMSEASDCVQSPPSAKGWEVESPMREGQDGIHRRTPSRGEESLADPEPFVAPQGQEVPFGFPFYPIILDERGNIDPQFLEKIGLRYADERTLSRTPGPSSRQHTAMPSGQSPFFEDQEIKFSPQSVPPSQLPRNREHGRPSSLIKQRSPSAKPWLSPNGRLMAPSTHTLPRQPPAGSWFVSQSSESSTHLATPATRFRRKETFIAEDPGNKGKVKWKEDSLEESTFRRMAASSSAEHSCHAPSSPSRFSELGWALAKMRTSNQGRAKYAWYLVSLYEPRKDLVYVLSGMFAGQCRTVRQFDLKKYSQEAVQSLIASGQEVDTKIAVSMEEIARNRTPAATTCLMTSYGNKS